MNVVTNSLHSAPDPQVFFHRNVLHIDYGTHGRVTKAGMLMALDFWERNLQQPTTIMLFGNRLIYVDYDAACFASHPNLVDKIQGLALIAVSPLERLLGQMFLKHHRPSYPVKIFEDREPGYRWLESLAAELPA